MNEAELVIAAREGDLNAYEQLMKLHLPGVRAFLALRSPVLHLVDDLCHETFVFAYRRLKGFEPGTAFGAWLRAIAHNLLRSALLKHAREERQRERYARFFRSNSERTNTEEGLLEVDEEADEVRALRACLESIPERQRELIDMKYQARSQAAEIAEKLGRSEDWVYQNLSRIRKALRSCIDKRLAGGMA